MPNRKAATATSPQASASAPLTFVDGKGGALAALAAGVARAAGRPDALATTTSAVVSVPPEVATVLAEIGAAPVPVDFAVDGHGDPNRIDLASWGLVLHEGDGEGELERLALARIARDRIARRLELSG